MQIKLIVNMGVEKNWVGFLLRNRVSCVPSVFIRTVPTVINRSLLKKAWMIM
jgi:hypothetical protein